MEFCAGLHTVGPSALSLSSAPSAVSGRVEGSEGIFKASCPAVGRRFISGERAAV